MICAQLVHVETRLCTHSGDDLAAGVAAQEPADLCKIIDTVDRNFASQSSAMHDDFEALLAAVEERLAPAVQLTQAIAAMALHQQQHVQQQQNHGKGKSIAKGTLAANDDDDPMSDDGGATSQTDQLPYQPPFYSKSSNAQRRR